MNKERKEYDEVIEKLALIGSFNPEKAATLWYDYRNACNRDLLYRYIMDLYQIASWRNYATTDLG